MINVPLLTWTNTPSAKGPVAQVAVSYAVDPLTRVALRGGILGQTYVPQVVAVDNTGNVIQASITFNGVAYFIGANTRVSFPIPDGTTSLDATATGGATTLVFYADRADAPPDQPNYSGLLLAAVTAAIPAGFCWPWAGVGIPSGWLECDGASYTTAAQPSLFAALAYTWGGAGVNFNVPDFRDRVLIGVSPGGLAGNRATARALGATGGEETHALTVAELAIHAHSYTYEHALSDLSVFGVGGGVVGFFEANQFPAGTTGNAGSGTAHNVMQPFGVVRWCIKT